MSRFQQNTPTQVVLRILWLVAFRIEPACNPSVTWVFELYVPSPRSKPCRTDVVEDAVVLERNRSTKLAVPVA